MDNIWAAFICLDWGDPLSVKCQAKYGGAGKGEEWEQTQGGQSLVRFQLRGY